MYSFAVSTVFGLPRGFELALGGFSLVSRVPMTYWVQPKRKKRKKEDDQGKRGRPGLQLLLVAGRFDGLLLSVSSIAQTRTRSTGRDPAYA
jgi:hypothetical protein